MMLRKILFVAAALVLSYFVGSRFDFVPILKTATALAQGQRSLSSRDSKSGSRPAADASIGGGDIAPIRAVADPYPVFDGIALDPANNLVAISDENHHSLLVYDRASGGKSDAVTEPRRRIMGAATEMGFVAGVTMDPEHHEVYTVNNDSGDQVTVYSYQSDGNAVPARRLFVPHQSWGLSLALGRGELAVTTQELNAVEIYSRTAKDLTKPSRQIVGMDTGLADPHGVVMDDRHPDIVGPVRVPLDIQNNELAEANYRCHTAQLVSRTDSGNVAPKRIVRNAPPEAATCGFTNASAAAHEPKRGEILVPN